MPETETVEHEDLEIVEAPSESLQDDDVVHIGCCTWWLWAATGRRHYALCGVDLTDQPSRVDAPESNRCKTCEEILESTRGEICPMTMFGRTP